MGLNLWKYPVMQFKNKAEKSGFAPKLNYWVFPKIQTQEKKHR